MYQLDFFFSNGEGDPVHFERRWTVIPNVGDTIWVDAGENIEWVSTVARRVFFTDEDTQNLRVHIHTENVEMAVVGSTDAADGAEVQPVL